MGYTLKFEHPHFPDDYEFAINGLGVIKNGSTLEIDEEHERLFIAERGLSLEDAFSSREGIATLTGNSTISADELQSLLPPPPAEEENANVDNSNSSSVATNLTVVKEP